MDHVQAQEDYERRLREEMDAKLQKEREIEELVRTFFELSFSRSILESPIAAAHLLQAQLELELINRLRNKQTEQKKAFQQLEAVLSLGRRVWIEPQLSKE